MVKAKNILPKHPFQIDTSHSSLGKLIEFLDTHLPNFPAAFKQMNSSGKIKAEDDISQELWVYLQWLAYEEKIFMFQFQRKHRNSRRSSDLGVLTVEHYSQFERSKCFFLIEAKRLPTPGTGRQKEYVEGNLGGMQRYKKGQHGKGLPASAMVGYIQDQNSCQHWANEINSWIKILINTNKDPNIHWDKNDYLVATRAFVTTNRYFSKNKRITDSESDSILLHHYLMELV